jgi:predicted acylesterase/phospholipase RssA
LGFCEKAAWLIALQFHKRKVILLKLVLMQCVMHNGANVLAAASYQTNIDYVFCATGNLLGTCLLLSSAATAMLRRQPIYVKQFFRLNPRLADIAQMFSHSHPLDQILDGVVGIMVVNISMNKLVWYVGNLPLDIPWSDVRGHFSWHVSSWMACLLWSTFVLGVYDRSQKVVKAPACLARSGCPWVFTASRYAFLQDIADSVLARVMTFCALMTTISILTMMASDMNGCRIGDTCSLYEKRRIYFFGLMVSDALRLLPALPEPSVINGQIYLYHAFNKLLSIAGLAVVIAFVVARLPESSTHMSYCVVLLVHLASFICNASSLMTWLARRQRSIHLLHKDDGAASVSASVDASQTQQAGSNTVSAIPRMQVMLQVNSGKQRPLRILCLDGGGAKGFNTLLMLQTIERGCGKPINQMFDLICGTSIGASIGAALSVGMSIENLIELIEGLCYKGCDTAGPVFPTKSKWRLLTKGYRIHNDVVAKYMEHVVQSCGVQGEDPMPAPTEGSDPSRVAHFFSVATEEQKHDKWMPFVCSNYPRQGKAFTNLGASGWPMHLQLHASAAAPTYFPPVTHPDTKVQYVDGAITSNNPSMLAIQEARALWPGRPIGCLVSLGTGEPVAAENSKAGLTYWLGQMKSMVVETYRTHKEVQTALTMVNGSEAPRPYYCRLQPAIPNVRLDENREHVLNGMKRATAHWIAAKGDKFHSVCSAVSMLSNEAIDVSPKSWPSPHFTPRSNSDPIEVNV